MVWECSRRRLSREAPFVIEALFLVSPSPVQEYADSLGVPFLETSAKTATNVEQAFLTMAAEIKTRVSSSPTQNDSRRPNLHIQSRPLSPEGADQGEDGSKGCC